MQQRERAREGEKERAIKIARETHYRALGESERERGREETRRLRLRAEKDKKWGERSSSLRSAARRRARAPQFVSDLRRSRIVPSTAPRAHASTSSCPAVFFARNAANRVPLFVPQPSPDPFDKLTSATPPPVSPSALRV